jgi:hypothetical protein
MVSLHVAHGISHARIPDELSAKVRRYGHQEIIRDLFAFVGFDGFFLGVDLGDVKIPGELDIFLGCD